MFYFVEDRGGKGIYLTRCARVMMSTPLVSFARKREQENRRVELPTWGGIELHSDEERETEIVPCTVRTTSRYLVPKNSWFQTTYCRERQSIRCVNYLPARRNISMYIGVLSLAVPNTALLFRAVIRAKFNRCVEQASVSRLWAGDMSSRPSSTRVPICNGIARGMHG